MKNRLNLGCGKDVRTGWINLDRAKLPGVDVVHDLTILPLPFPNDTFDEVLCKDILEHIDDYSLLLKDLYRLLKPGGILHIRVPHFTSKDAYSDPTHKRFFTVHTFRYYTEEHLRSYYFDFCFSRVERVYLHFDIRPAYFYNWILEKVVNAGTRFQNYYEGSPFRIFPATNIEILLVK